MAIETLRALGPRIAQRLVEIHQALTLKGDLLNTEPLPGYYAAFRQVACARRRRADADHARASPQGQPRLLARVKNDAELPSTKLGSIMGGSAHKFNLFRRAIVRIATELGWPMVHLTRVLNVRHGNPSRCWRIGTYPGGDRAFWADVLRGSTIAFDGEKIGDLSSFLSLSAKKISRRSSRALGRASPGP